ncbi:MAG TPA: pyridoxamine 5'-phosphate oxidase family protein [Vicinamibacterales bacterium]|jgi:nitroimidazol reductase NimA-like FMN-containing flavoprotein (pyridoxamine 5'-phosphate oxidase superfamily)
MRIKALSLEECQDALRRAGVGRLACVRYNQPYIVPISFELVDDALYGFAMAGRKIHWMRSNPNVCVEVDDIRDRFNWTSVIVEGRYEELTDSKTHEADRARAEQLFRGRPHWRYPASATLDPARALNPVFYRIQIESISGRHAFQPSRLDRLKVATRAARLRQWWRRVARIEKPRVAARSEM